MNNLDYNNFSMYPAGMMQQPNGFTIQNQNVYGTDQYGNSQALREFYVKKAIEAQIEHGKIEHKSDRNDQSVLVKSNATMAEIDHRENLRRERENTVVSVNRNPEQGNKICLQYTDLSGNTHLSKPICQAKDLLLTKVKSYHKDKTYLAYCVSIEGMPAFFIMESDMSAVRLAEELTQNGYPISYMSNRKGQTYIAVYDFLKSECDKLSTATIPFSVGWSYYTSDDGTHWRFDAPDSKLYFMSDIMR